MLMAAIVLSALLSSLSAQILNPVRWEVSSEMTSPTEGVIRYSATIEPGWHLYGTTLPDGGPKATSISYDRMEGVELVGELVPSQAPVEKIDMTFNLKLNWWEGDVVLSQKFRLKDGSKGYAVAGVITFQGCNDGSCIPPTREPDSRAKLPRKLSRLKTMKYRWRHPRLHPLPSTGGSRSCFPITEKPPVRI